VRQALFEGDLDVAIVQLGKLIKNGESLDKIVEDLETVLHHHPVDSIVWQTLGDAYAKCDRLQDALNAYTQAEEIL